jgi:hypothetical protein
MLLGERPGHGTSCAQHGAVVQAGLRISILIRLTLLPNGVKSRDKSIRTDRHLTVSVLARK